MFREERSNCPFYGFYICLDSKEDKMIYQEGNRCAFITNDDNPCKMESEGLKPLWKDCALNSKENREKLEFFLREIRVLPNNPFLQGKNPERTLALRNWMAYVKKRASSSQ